MRIENIPRRPPAEPEVESLLDRLIRPAGILAAITVMLLIAWPNGPGPLKLGPGQIVGEIVCFAVCAAVFDRSERAWGSRLLAAVLGTGWTAVLVQAYYLREPVSVHLGLGLGLLAAVAWAYAILGLRDVTDAVMGRSSTRTADRSGWILVALVCAFGLGCLVAIAKPLTGIPAVETPVVALLQFVFVACAAAAVRCSNPVLREALVYMALSTVSVSAIAHALGRPLDQAQQNEIGFFVVGTALFCFRMLKAFLDRFYRA